MDLLSQKRGKRHPLAHTFEHRQTNDFNSVWNCRRKTERHKRREDDGVHITQLENY